MISLEAKICKHFLIIILSKNGLRKHLQPILLLLWLHSRLFLPQSKLKWSNEKFKKGNVPGTANLVLTNQVAIRFFEVYAIRRGWTWIFLPELSLDAPHPVALSPLDQCTLDVLWKSQRIANAFRGEAGTVLLVLRSTSLY